MRPPQKEKGAETLVAAPFEALQAC